MRTLTKSDPNFDLEDPDDFRTYEKLRLELVQKANKLNELQKLVIPEVNVNDLSPEIRHKLYKFLYGETLFPNADGSTETQSTNANEEVKQSPAVYPEKNYQDFYLDYIDKLTRNDIRSASTISDIH